MGIGVSLVLIAAGAILTWGVTAEAEGLDVNAVGVILMAVGLLGLLLSLLFWGDRAPWRRRTVVADPGPDVVVERRARPMRRTTVVEDDEVAPGPPGPPAA